mgnify:CR=1 FL=1
MRLSLACRPVALFVFVVSYSVMAQTDLHQQHVNSIGPTDQLRLSASTQFNSSSDSGRHITSQVAAFKEVGRGEMEWWWFTLYRARLLTPNGEYQQGHYPMVLEIEYYQDIPNERLLEATVDQWQHLQLEQGRQSQWQASLSELWPDVNEGDILSLQVLSSDKSQFFFNGEPLPQVMPKGFSDDFLAIWLSTNTSRPELRKQLLGEVACDC